MYTIKVIGKFTRYTGSALALYASMFRESKVLFSQSATYTGVLGTEIDVAAYSSDTTNFPATSTKVSVIYDSTGGTAGSIGLFLKLVSRTNMYTQGSTSFDMTMYSASVIASGWVSQNTHINYKA